MPNNELVAKALHTTMIKLAIDQKFIPREHAVWWKNESEECRENWRTVAMVARFIFTGTTNAE